MFELLEITLYAALACIAIGYLPYVVIRAMNKLRSLSSFAAYTVLLVSFVIPTAFLGFIVGFVGPIFLMPSSNQGPMIGIFITGPLGALAGLIAFWVYFYLKLKHKSWQHETS